MHSEDMMAANLWNAFDEIAAQLGTEAAMRFVAHWLKEPGRDRSEPAG